MLNPIASGRSSEFRKIVPTSKTSSTPVESAVITDVPFDSYLKYKTYDVGVKQDGVTKHYVGGFVHGPGHHIGAIAAMAFDSQMKPIPILKTGDTRLSRAERKQPYVKTGFVAGRMDKQGSDSSKIALAELAEEVGGEVVGKTFRPLGKAVNPTMPHESSEADAYYFAAVQLSGDPYGDGGNMELTDLIGPQLSSAQEAIASMDGSDLAEGGRTRAMFGRGFDAIGFVPQLDAYVHDHPKLLERFDTLGLGEVTDIRGELSSSEIPKQRPKADTLEAKVNDVVCAERREVSFDGESRMIDAKTQHAVNENGVITKLDNVFTNQYLQLDYDRAKIANYYVDAERGPMVQMKLDVRPALAFSPNSPNVLRQDVSDVKLSRQEDVQEQLPEGAVVLGQPSGASSGQTDLYYHFVANPVKAPENPQNEGYVTLSEAVELCRTGHGDAQTEALCERLSDHLGWIPNLGMSVLDAKALMSR